MKARASSIAFLLTAFMTFSANAAERVRIGYSESLEQLTFGHRPDAVGKPARLDRLAFDAFGRRFDLALEPNRRLVNAVDRASLRADVGIYRGSISGVPGSWTRLVVADGLPRGLVSDGRETFAIDVRAGSDTPVMYRLADLEIEPGTLACASAPAAASGSDLLTAAGSDVTAAAARGPGAVSQLDIAVIADFEFASDNGANAETALITRMNNVDGIFSEQLGVQLNVDRIDVFDAASDPFTDATDAGDLLGELADYRQRTPAQNANGLSHLFTGRNLDGTTVGIAFTGALCRMSAGAGLTQGSVDVTLDSLVAAHEIGHNFGAPHDDEADSACESTPPDFLMAPRVNGSDTFSACSIDQVEDDIAAAPCITPLPGTDIAVVAGSVPATVLLGDAATVGFEVNGVGTETADDVGLAISVPPGVTLDAATATAGSCTSGAGSVDCALGSVGAGSGVTVSLSVTAGDVGEKEFTATGTAASDANDFNNEASISFAVDPATDLAVTAPGGSQLMLDQATTVRPVVDNQATIAATDVVVAITSSAGLAVGGADWDAGSCSVDAAGATCTAASLAAGSSNTIDVELTGTAAGSQSYTVAAAAQEADRDAGNDEATGTVTVSDAPAPEPGNGPGDDDGGGGIGVGLLGLALAVGLRRRRRARARPGPGSGKEASCPLPRYRFDG